MTFEELKAQVFEELERSEGTISDVARTVDANCQTGS